MIIILGLFQIVDMAEIHNWIWQMRFHVKRFFVKCYDFRYTVSSTAESGPTCHNRIGTPGFHSKVDLRPVWAPEPLWGNLGTAAVGIEDGGWWVQGDHPLSQTRAHVERIKEPDQAEYAQANGDVNEDLANVEFLFLLFAVKCGGLLVFPWRGSGFAGHHPLPLPAHPALLKLEGGEKRKVFLIQ